MRTTLDLPDPLFRELKARAGRRGVKLKELLAVYVEAGLRMRMEETREATPPARSPLPIARAPDGTLTPALRNAELQGILDDEDRARPG